MSRSEEHQPTASPLDVFIEPRNFMESVITRRRWAFAGSMALLFVLVAVVSTYLVVKDETLVSAYLDRILEERPSQVSVERMEAARERTRLALQTPGIAVLVSLRLGASRLFQLTVLSLALAAGAGLAGRSTQVFPQVLLAAAASTPILTLGTAVNMLLRMAFRDLNAVASLLPLVGPCGGGTLGCFLIATVDIFALWYLVVVSLGVAVIVRWPTVKAVTVVGLLWALVVLCSFLTETGAGWTL